MLLSGKAPPEQVPFLQQDLGNGTEHSSIPYVSTSANYTTDSTEDVADTACPLVVPIMAASSAPESSPCETNQLQQSSNMHEEMLSGIFADSMLHIKPTSEMSTQTDDLPSFPVDPPPQYSLSAHSETGPASIEAFSQTDYEYFTREIPTSKLSSEPVQSQTASIGVGQEETAPLSETDLPFPLSVQDHNNSASSISDPYPIHSTPIKATNTQEVEQQSDSDQMQELHPELLESQPSTITDMELKQEPDERTSIAATPADLMASKEPVTDSTVILTPSKTYSGSQQQDNGDDEVEGAQEEAGKRVKHPVNQDTERSAAGAEGGKTSKEDPPKPIETPESAIKPRIVQSEPTACQDDEEEGLPKPADQFSTSPQPNMDGHLEELKRNETFSKKSAKTEEEIDETKDQSNQIDEHRRGDEQASINTKESTVTPQAEAPKSKNVPEATEVSEPEAQTSKDVSQDAQPKAPNNKDVQEVLHADAPNNKEVPEISQPDASKCKDVEVVSEAQAPKNEDVPQVSQPEASTSKDLLEPEDPKIKDAPEVSQLEALKGKEAPEVSEPEAPKSNNVPEVSDVSQPEASKNKDVSEVSEPKAQKREDVSEVQQPQAPTNKDVTEVSKPEAPAKKHESNVSQPEAPKSKILEPETPKCKDVPEVSEAKTPKSMDVPEAAPPEPIKDI